MHRVGFIYMLQRFEMQTQVNLTDPWGAVWVEVGKTIWLFLGFVQMCGNCLPSKTPILPCNDSSIETGQL